MDRIDKLQEQISKEHSNQEERIHLYSEEVHENEQMNEIQEQNPNEHSNQQEEIHLSSEEVIEDEQIHNIDEDQCTFSTDNTFDWTSSAQQWTNFFKVRILFYVIFM